MTKDYNHFKYNYIVTLCFLSLELDIYLITNYNFFYKMVTNTIIIVAIMLALLGITSSPLVFGEIQSSTLLQDSIFKDPIEVSSLDLMNKLFTNNNIDNKKETYNNQHLTPQSHGLIKNKDIGVLVYTHGNPMMPHNADTMKTELIEKNLEKMGHPSEIVTHMPYNWDQGLMNLDQENIKYAVFLYTDLFGPMSTVIHNVTRGIFGEIERYQFCPGVPMPNDSCLYMGMLTEPASKVSDTTLVFAEPARPDHPIIRNAFVEQAEQISEIPRKEILVLVGHGARSDTNDMYQVRELQNLADYVQYKMGFKEALAVTAREDWPDLQEQRIMEIVEQVKKVLMKTHAEKVILAPATGAGMGFQMVKEALESEGIDVDEAADPLSFAQKEFKKWSSLVMKETVEFIKKNAPQENTITPQWNRNYR